MPIIDVKFAKPQAGTIDANYKAHLIHELTKACRDIFNCAADAVEVRLEPVAPENHGVGGFQLSRVTGAGTPIVDMRVSIYPGREPSAKHALAYALTEAAASVLKVAAGTVEICITETDPKTSYVGGKPFVAPV